jgi:hypothetical protein
MISLLDQNTQCAQQLFKQAHPNQNDGYHAMQFYSENLWNSLDTHHSISKQTVKQLLEASIKLLQHNHFQIDIHQFFIETHLYQVKNSLESGPFALHQDDDGAMSGKVVTIIWYLKKDKSIKGGDLLFSKLDCSLDKTNRLPIQDNMIVMFSGDIWHVPEQCSGTGTRQLVSIQFRDVARTIPSTSFSEKLKLWLASLLFNDEKQKTL